MKTLKFLLLMACFGWSSTSSIGGDYLRVTRQALIGQDPILKYIGLQVDTKYLSGAYQIGIMSSIAFPNATIGVVGFSSNDSLVAGAGHIPYHYAYLAKPMALGAGAGVARQAAFKSLDFTGCDSECLQLDLGRGKSRLADTLELHGLLLSEGGINYHGRYVSASGQITDTDYVLVFDLGGGALEETLSTIGSSTGRGYFFIQYKTAAAGNLVIHPHAGDTIQDGLDSVVISSNTGDAYVEFYGIGNRWKCVRFHEAGIFQTTLVGDSPSVVDTGYYTLNNAFDVDLDIKYMSGTSNASTLQISGMNSHFTNPLADSTQQTSWSGGALSNGTPVNATCFNSWTGSNISCFVTSTTLGSWLAFGQKTIWGMHFHKHFVKEPPH